MNEIYVPALVPADPEANATDLLVDRVALSPEAPLFALPTADGGWEDVTTAEFHRQVVALQSWRMSVHGNPPFFHASAFSDIVATKSRSTATRLLLQTGERCAQEAHRRRLQAVTAHGAIDGASDDARLLQHLEVFGDC